MSRLSSAGAPRIYLWRYRENRRNYPGYHLTADVTGCELLINALSRHENTKAERQSLIPLSPVTPGILAVPANRRGDPTVVSFGALLLSTQPGWAAERFELSESYPQCRLELSSAQAGCMLEGVRDIQRGKGDYCVGGEGDHVVWFWWYGGSQ